MGGGGWRYPSPSRPAPVPTQERARDTVRAAIEATVQLLDREPEQHVTLEAIRLRSGVSQGSLTHHFGSRDGLIAAAHVERYVRICEADRAFLQPFVGALHDPQAFVATILGMVEEMLSEHRHEIRWVRLTAIAAAVGDDDLTRTLGETYTALTTSLTTIVESAHASGILPADVDARTVALLLTMHAQGLVLDDLSGVAVDRATWDHLQSRFVGAFVDPEAAALLQEESQRRSGELWRAEVLGETGRVPETVATRLAALRVRAGQDGVTTDASRLRSLIEVAAAATVRDGGRTAGRGAEVFETLLRAATVRLRAQGDRGIDVTELRTQAGVSPQTFYRLFSTRDALVREARVQLEIARAARSVTRFGALVASSRTPADLRRAVVDDAMRMADDAARSAMWQRIETIAAARTDMELRATLGRVQRAARDLLIEQVCLAQQRKIMDPSLPPTGIARLLDGSVFWHVFHGLDAQRPPREVWVGMLSRIAAFLSPDH